ncbi:PC4-domain-containing protein [Heliocybe sulcata]|uniref:PC4-domain-containing protein n=1 Tax=Heliocybe sulcata TaxID=5364 RepID=A0A5C3NAE4_9AGAM|nr:PC4-domain-containing protein [Heliocybe sulcata]
MAKRKAESTSGDDDEQHDEQSGSSSEEAEKPLAKKAKPSKFAAPRKTKKANSESSDAGDDDEGDEVEVRTSRDGEQYVDLGRKRRATVRPFKGKMYLDVREFYGDEGDEKPGKKGISLSSDEWDTLKRSIATIDRMFTQIPSDSKRRK